MSQLVAIAIPVGFDRKHMRGTPSGSRERLRKTASGPVA